MENLIELIDSSYSLSNNPQAKQDLLARLPELSSAQQEEVFNLLQSERDELKQVEEQYSDEKAMLDAQFVNKARILLTNLSTTLNHEKEVAQDVQDNAEAEAALNNLE